MSKRAIAVLFIVAGASLLLAQNSREHPRQEAKRLTRPIAEGMRPNTRPHSEIVRALAVLEELNSEMRGTNLLVAFLLGHQDPKVRMQAASALAEIARSPDWQPRAAADLANQLEDRNADVRAACLMALARMGGAGKVAIQKGIDASTDDDPKVRRAAVTMLGGLARGDTALIKLLVTALDDADKGPFEKEPGLNAVSMIAMFHLQACKSEAKAAIPKLVRFANEGKVSDSHQMVALRALAAVEPEHPLTLVMGKRWLDRKDDPKLMLKGASLLLDLGPRAAAAIPDLIGALKMPPMKESELEFLMKSEILAVFRSMGPAAKEALPFLRSMPAREDPNMRGYVEEAITSIEGKK